MIQAKVLWATSSDLPAGWPLLSHAHNFYHLFSLQTGKAVFILDGEPHEILAGQCLIIPPGMSHEVPAEAHSLLTAYEVKFTLDVPATLPLICTSDDYIERSLQNILYSWTLGEDPDRKNAGMFLSAMLTAIVTAPTAEKQVSTYIETACYPPLIRRIIHYIEQTHTDSFSLDQLAQQLGYNKRYLCSAFRSATGYTILDYLNHVRIRHATNCFYYYDVPIGVIAENVGFITAVHFTRVFKKLVGISPSTFRSHYNLGHDPSENRRLTGSEVSAYDEILGVKILPLDDAVQALRELGRRTKER